MWGHTIPHHAIVKEDKGTDLSFPTDVARSLRGRKVLPWECRFPAASRRRTRIGLRFRIGDVWLVHRLIDHRLVRGRLPTCHDQVVKLATRLVVLATNKATGYCTKSFPKWFSIEGEASWRI